MVAPAAQGSVEWVVVGKLASLVKIKKKCLTEGALFWYDWHCHGRGPRASAAVAEEP
jgi:hypothetical protein